MDPMGGWYCDIIRNHLTFNVGDGKKFWLWSDPWVSNCFLSEIIGSDCILSLGKGSNYKISYVIVDGSFCVPPSHRLTKLNKALRSFLEPSGCEDVLLFDNKASIKFSDVWNVMRHRECPPSWSRWLWSSKAPRRVIMIGWKCFQ